jgi:hypothetical protein
MKLLKNSRSHAPSDFHEQGWGKWRFGLKTRQAAEILEIRILLAQENRFFVAQFQFMLDDRRQ